MNKLTLIIISLILLIYPVYGLSNVTVFTLENTNDRKFIQFDNNIASEFIIQDNTDRITELYIELENSGYTNNTALLISFENNVSYVIETNKYYWLYIIPYIELRHRLFFDNYTIFNKTRISNNIIPQNIIVDFSYDMMNGNTTITAGNFLQAERTGNLGFPNTSFNYYSNLFIGLPASNIKSIAQSKFKAKITYEDISSKLSIASKKNKLSLISSLIYAIIIDVARLLTFNFSLDNETLIDILLLLDSIFWIITILTLLIFKYPYLILVWILTISNFYVAWKSTSLREILFNYSDYFKFIGNMFYKLAINIWTIIIRIVHAIRG